MYHARKIFEDAMLHLNPVFFIPSLELLKYHTTEKYFLHNRDSSSLSVTKPDIFGCNCSFENRTDQHLHPYPETSHIGFTRKIIYDCKIRTWQKRKQLRLSYLSFLLFLLLI